MSRIRALTVAERVAFAARRVPPSYLRSQRDVPTRWWGRSYGCGAVVPPERHLRALDVICVHSASLTTGVIVALVTLPGLYANSARQ